MQPKQTKPNICDLGVKSYIEAHHKCFAVATIDKAASNFAFVWKKKTKTKIKNVSKISADVGLCNSKSKKYSKANRSIEKMFKKI